MSDTGSDAEPTGWSARGVSSLTLAALAAFFAFLFLYEDRAAAEGASGLWAFVAGVLIFHALGGMVAGWALAGGFGRRGAVGWIVAVLVGIAATLLAGLLGGVFAALPGLVSGSATLMGEAIRIGAAAFVTPFAIAEAPWLAGVWAVAILGLHVAVGRLRS